MISLDFGFQDTVVVVTGAAGQIGQVITEAFLQAGCFGVAGLDIDTAKCSLRHEKLVWEEVDITNETTVQAAWDRVKTHFSRVPTVCVHAAGLDLSFVTHFSSITEMPVEQFTRTVMVNTVGSFITAKTWLKALQEREDDAEDYPNKSLIVMGSEAGTFGVLGNSDYSASKAALVGLCLSIAPDAAKVSGRVNIIAPGAVDTPQFKKECIEDDTGKTRWIDAEATVALKKPVDIKHIARLCLVLASDEWSGSTTGQVLQPNGGKSGRIFWGQDGEPIA